MPLNVKLALPLSIVVIAGFFYALQYIDPKSTSDANPLAAAKLRPEATGAARPVGVRPTPANNRFTLTPSSSSAGLAARSPVERARDAAPKINDTMVVRDTPTAGDSAERIDPPALLPPRSDLARGTPPPDIDANVGGRSPAPVTLIAKSTPESSAANSPSAEVLPNTRAATPVTVAEPLPTPVTATAKTYVVKTGDNLTKIARRALNSDTPDAVKRMLDANPQLKGRADRILVGMTLHVPDDSSATPPARELNGNVATTRVPDAAARPSKTPALEKPVADSAAGNGKTKKDAAKDTRRRGTPVKPVQANAKSADGAAGGPTPRPLTADAKIAKNVPPSAPTNSTVIPPQDVKVVGTNGAHGKPTGSPTDAKRATTTGQTGLKKANQMNPLSETQPPASPSGNAHAAKPEGTPSLKKLPPSGSATDAAKGNATRGASKTDKPSTKSDKAGRVAEKPGARNNERDAKLSKRTDRPA